MGVKQVKRDGAQHPGRKTNMCKGPEIRKSLAFGSDEKGPGRPEQISKMICRYMCECAARDLKQVCRVNVPYSSWPPHLKGTIKGTPSSS